MCDCVSKHEGAFVCLCELVYTYIYIYIHISVCQCWSVVFLFVFFSVCLYTCLCVLFVCSFVCVYSYIYIYIYVCVCVSVSVPLFCVSTPARQAITKKRVHKRESPPLRERLFVISSSVFLSSSFTRQVQEKALRQDLLQRILQMIFYAHGFTGLL